MVACPVCRERVYLAPREDGEVRAFSRRRSPSGAWAWNGHVMVWVDDAAYAGHNKHRCRREVHPRP